MSKNYIIVDLFSGSYNEKYIGFEVFNTKRNRITKKFHGYLPPHDNPNIIRLGAEKSDEYVDEILIVFVKKISKNSTVRKVIGFYPSARVYKERQSGENIDRSFHTIDGSSRIASYSIESDDFYAVDESLSLIINPKNYNEYMFRMQRVYSGTYPELDKIIYEYINSFLTIESVEDDMFNQINLQESLQASEDEILSAPNKKPVITIYESGQKLSRDSRLAKSAIIKSGYSCEYNTNHKTFINKNNEQYMEGHHLIPYTIQNAGEIWEKFYVNIDCIENIVSLCPICHKAIHLGNKNERRKILSKLIKSHLPKLKNIGIDVEKEYIFNLYGL